jgi:ABC-type taurine transport system substrate-binding protein
LAKYGKVISHDFAEEFPEMKAESSKIVQPIVSYEDLEKDRDSWKEKYFQVADLLHKCLQQQNKR